VEGSLHAKNQLHLSSRFDTILDCDVQMGGQTDRQTHDNSIHVYSASIVLCSKNCFDSHSQENLYKIVDAVVVERQNLHIVTISDAVSS